MTSAINTDEGKKWIKTLLRSQEATIVFVKSDGTERKMTCTLSESKIPSEKMPKNSGKAQNDNVLPVFDVEKQEWRSFRYDSVVKVEFSLKRIKKMKYIIETLSTFREIHVVEAENEEIAKKIAMASDYNMSKWLGQQVTTIYDHSEHDIQRLKKEDEYFWEGVKSVDEEGYLCYQKPGGEPVRSAMEEKII